jgi:diguanylate cyclase (GGDEF)-like protein/PAS domain S-box-containing protein
MGEVTMELRRRVARGAAAAGAAGAPAGAPAALAQATVDATAALVLVCDERGRILLANPALQQFTGRRSEELVGRLLWEILVIPEEVALAETAVTEAMSGTPRLPREVTWLAAGQVRRQVELQSSVLERDGVCYATAFVGIDVTEQRAREKSLLERATTDALTGLANRGALFEALAGVLDAGSGQPAGSRCGLLFCDLDDFKRINDAYGHGAGDRVLAEAAARLRGLAAAGDVVARLGGDEFVLLRPAADAPSLAALADAVRARMTAPFDQAVPGLVVSTSTGTALARPGDTADELMARADSAMYGAKGRRYRAAGRRRSA